MEKTKIKKSKSEKSTVIGTVFSTILYVVLLIILILAIVINVSKQDNQITTIFGYAFAVVQSGSMVDGGFEVGDMVIIQDVNTDDLKVGDIVVFYDYQDPVDLTLSLTNISNEVQNGTYQDFKNPDYIPANRHDSSYAINNGDKLIFHRIIAIYRDDAGTRFFETKGDSNNVADKIKVREDFVCAKYKQSSVVLQSVLGFMSTTLGLVVIILIPIGMLLISQVISFTKDMKTNMNAIKLLERKVRYSDINLEECDIEHYFTAPEKVYLYDITPPEDKANIAIILWSEGVGDALEAYNKNRDDYYNYFYQSFSKGDQKKLKFLHLKANIIHKNPNISEEEVNAQVKEILKNENNTER